jgi:hypothetical protein
MIVVAIADFANDLVKPWGHQRLSTMGAKAKVVMKLKSPAEAGKAWEKHLRRILGPRERYKVGS